MCQQTFLSVTDDLNRKHDSVKGLSSQISCCLVKTTLCEILKKGKKKFGHNNSISLGFG